MEGKVVKEYQVFDLLQDRVGAPGVLLLDQGGTI